MSEESTDREQQPECDTVRCHEYPTAFIRFRIKREFCGEERESVVRGRYCDRHTEMWEKFDSDWHQVEVLKPEANQ